MSAQLIDCLHLDIPRAIGCWLLPGEGPMLVDPGPEACTDALLAGLRAHGLELAEVGGLLLTHIHLDHAGASGRLVELNPELEVYVHERGAPHMADPARLVASAARLYGDRMERLWGDVVPVPEANLRPLAGGERLRLAGRELRVAYTPGHASHHVCYLDSCDGAAYVGDVAGVRIPPAGFVLAPTPPPDLDLEAWRASLALVEAWEPNVLRFTHFGETRSVTSQLAAVRERLVEWGEHVRRDVGREDAEAISEFEAWIGATLREAMGEEEACTYEHVAPADQIWMGLARYWRKRDAGAAVHAPARAQRRTGAP